MAAVYRQDARSTAHAARPKVRHPLRGILVRDQVVVSSVTTAVPDSHKYWNFNDVFSTPPSVSDAACLQLSDGLGGWLSPVASALLTVSGENTRLELTYSDSGSTDWRVNGSTAGLSFIDGEVLATGASGTLS